MSTKITEKEAFKLLSDDLKVARIKGIMTKVTYEKSNSYSREGRYDARSLEAALEIAKNYVIRKNHEGTSARVLVSIYEREPEGWLCRRTIDMQSPFAGERNHLGYALPDPNRLDEVDYTDWGF